MVTPPPPPPWIGSLKSHLIAFYINQEINFVSKEEAIAFVFLMVALLSLPVVTIKCVSG